MPKKVRIENMQNFDFDLALNRWGADYDDPYALLNLYTSDRFANSNYGRWVNEEFDSLIYSARDELATQPEERWQALIDAEAVMMDELPLIPLYQNGEATLIRTGVTGMDYHFVGIEWIYRDLNKTPHKGNPVAEPTCNGTWPPWDMLGISHGVFFRQACGL